MRKLPTISGGSGPRLERLTGRVACIEVRDDRGEPIPPDAMLEGAPARPILVARDLFETSSPETAVARLGGLGVRVIISPGFDSRFHQRCLSYGMLPVPLEDGAVDALAAWVLSHPDAELTVDLDKQTIERPDGAPVAFDVEPRVRQKLLLGLTDMEEMLRHVSSTAALREDDRKKRPWLYGRT
jgi:3-isopropylmalate/(R)-2-methylmalate dehydratase small subunit